MPIVLFHFFFFLFLFWFFVGRPTALSHCKMSMAKCTEKMLVAMHCFYCPVETLYFALIHRDFICKMLWRRTHIVITCAAAHTYICRWAEAIKRNLIFSPENERREQNKRFCRNEKKGTRAQLAGTKSTNANFLFLLVLQMNRKKTNIICWSIGKRSTCGCAPTLLSIF